MEKKGGGFVIVKMMGVGLGLVYDGVGGFGLSMFVGCGLCAC